ncbi:hypothetical protein HanPSC8_Chr03g0120001 [Helianthus annuus]|nr:hypothetical protein HanPSC8_Chr03g0120001 [Helianthus annuus]
MSRFLVVSCRTNCWMVFVLLMFKTGLNPFYGRAMPNFCQKHG